MPTASTEGKLTLLEWSQILGVKKARVESGQLSQRKLAEIEHWTNVLDGKVPLPEEYRGVKVYYLPADEGALAKAVWGESSWEYSSPEEFLRGLLLAAKRR